MKAQQVFLRESAAELHLTQKGLALRMSAPWDTFRKWMAPVDSSNYREMPDIAWQLIREILAHEKLKLAKKNNSTSGAS